MQDSRTIHLQRQVYSGNLWILCAWIYILLSLKWLIREVGESEMSQQASLGPLSRFMNSQAKPIWIKQ